MKHEQNCVAKTFAGLETILADELTALQAKNVKVLNRAVSFSCNKETLYRINLRSRFAISVLVEWANFWARDEENFYKEMKKVNWDDFLSTEKTFMIRTNVMNSKTFTHSQYIGLKAKDAIADFFFEKYQKRPDVNTDDPDVKIHVYINGNKVSVSLNSSGEPLFKRGYRITTGYAPINEVLAAGMIELSGWDGQQVFYDPMCGSGTILIEAAMKAHNIPPGMKRRFGFQTWLNYSPPLWEKVFKEETQKITDSEVTIYGSDKDGKVLQSARENISAAFVEDSVRVSRKNFFQEEWTKDEMPFMVFNPPYDKRLQNKDVVQFYKTIGDTLKFKYAGAEAWIISAHLDAMKRIGLRPSKKLKLYNGPLECRFCQYKLYKGSRKG